MAERVWALALHGGAKEIAPGRGEENREGLMAALEAGSAVLRRGGSALDAVEAAVRKLEDLPVFNAGHGSVPNADGEAEMDAAIMDGATLDLGGVAAIQGVRHPVSVAKLMLREVPTLLVGAGAARFARERGAELCDNREMLVAQELQGHDTVGAVALDADGHVAAATSTGGLEGCVVGRVGDSPLPGCGLYAEDAVGACCFSGHGEFISRTMLAARVMFSMDEKGPQTAMEQALEVQRRLGGEAGGIAVARDGRVGWAHNSPHFAVGVATSAQPPRAFLAREEASRG